MNELKGYYECDECSHAEYNPKNRVCSKCGGELVYMMTLQDEVDEIRKERDKLRAENERLRETLREIANSAGIDGCGFTSGEGHADCVWKARKALNEVTK